MRPILWGQFCPTCKTLSSEPTCHHGLQADGTPKPNSFPPPPPPFVADMTKLRALQRLGPPGAPEAEPWPDPAPPAGQPARTYDGATMKAMTAATVGMGPPLQADIRRETLERTRRQRMTRPEYWQVYL